VQDLGDGWTRRTMIIVLTTIVGDFLTVEIGQTPSYAIRISQAPNKRLRAPDVRVRVEANSPQYREGEEHAIFDGDPKTEWELQYEAEVSEYADVIVDFERAPELILSVRMHTDERTAVPGILREPLDDDWLGTRPDPQAYDEATGSYIYDWFMAADRKALTFRFGPDRENYGPHDYFIDDVVLIRDLYLTVVPTEVRHMPGFMDLRAKDMRW
jgi:hypothetical protein